LPLSSSSSTFPQICSSISTADFAFKLNFPSNLLGNFDSRFASKRLCVKSSSTFPQICSAFFDSRFCV